MQLTLGFDAPGPPAHGERRRIRRNGSRGTTSADQPCLPGLEQRRTDRLFLGLQPDGETGDMLSHRLLPDLQARHGLVVSPDRFAMFHISLVGLGCRDGVPPGFVADARAALSNFTHPPFEVTLDTVMRFHTSNAFVLTGGDGQDAVRSLGRELALALKRGGFRASAKACRTPHMTLCYGKQPLEPYRVAPVRWPVREVVMIDSWVRHSTHVALERWPLAAALR